MSITHTALTQPRSQRELTPDSKVVLSKAEARYVYCVADGCEKIKLARIGLEKRDVYTVHHKDLCAVIHACPPEPYNSQDQETVKGWVVAHNEVVEEAWRRFETVSPATFNTIVKGGDDRVEEWLRNDYERLKEILDKLKGKEEYGTQIFLDSRFLEELVRKDEDIKILVKETEGRPQGAAYFYRQKLESALKDKSEKKVENLFQEFYGMIKMHVDDTHVERVKTDSEGEIMIANLSLLMRREKVDELKEVLAEIEERKGVSVRFTGPWPPYSFSS